MAGRRAAENAGQPPARLELAAKRLGHDLGRAIEQNEIVGRRSGPSGSQRPLQTATLAAPLAASAACAWPPIPASSSSATTEPASCASTADE